MKNFNFHISFAVQICAISICMISATAIFFGYQSFQSEAARKASSLSREILAVVKTAAIQIDLERHEEIFFDPGDGLQGQLEFDQLRKVLAAISDANDLAHGHGSPLYTLRKSFDYDDSGELEFVVMTDQAENGEY